MTTSQQRDRKRVAQSPTPRNGTQLSGLVAGPINIHWSIGSGEPLAKAELIRRGLCTEVMVGCGFAVSPDSGALPAAAPSVGPTSPVATPTEQTK